MFIKLENDIFFKIQENFEIKDRQLIIELPPENLRNNWHFATNIAMILAKSNKINPFNLAIEMAKKIQEIKYIDAIEIIKPGFINFRLKDDFYYDLLKKVNENGVEYLIKNFGKNEKINIEFCSANPTGPMHIGHTRGAIFGDVLASILEKSGYNITKEYYINDAGNQIETLLKSVLIRINQVKNEDFSEKIPEGFYPGEYLIDIAKKVIKNKIKNEDLKQFIVNEMMNIIKLTLKKMKINYDIFTSELAIRKSGLLEKMIELLKEKDLCYWGFLSPPKGKEIENYEAKEMLIFKSTLFGDDCDRPIQRKDGSFTYIAPDGAYALDKYNRGFSKAILILGVDHKGYISRLKSISNVFPDNKMQTEIKLCELVNFVKNGENIKMSKRSGNFLTVDDVLEEIDIDILRFLILTKTSNTVFDFDFIKAKEQSKDNPVFYIQYAYSRCCSILENAPKNLPNLNYRINMLTYEHKTLLNLAILYTRFLELSAINLEPNLLINFAINLAKEFHSLWTLGSKDEKLKFINPNNLEQTKLNLEIVKIIQEIIKSIFEIIKIKPIEKM